MHCVHSPRTITQLHAEMIAADPNCALTLTALRRLVRCGAIKSCRVGSKYLVTHEAVEVFLSGKTEMVGGRSILDHGAIRPVDIRG